MATIKTNAVAMELEGLQPMLRAFGSYGREANAELRKASKSVATTTVTAAKARGASIAGAAALASETLRVKSDRVPSLIVGGSKRVGTHRHSAGAFLFGAEFGGRGRTRTQQFLPHRGTQGYFLFPTLRERGHHDTMVYLAALDGLGAKWAGVR
jgi:hypothetical protein